MGNKYKPNGFENRFSRIVLDEYRDKLETLPPEKRAEVVDKLRERFREYEDDPQVNDEKQVVEFFKKWHVSIETHRSESDRIVNEACEGQRYDKAQETSPGVKGHKKGADQKQEYAQKLRDDLKAKMAKTRQSDHDRER